jgi:hypothetical protein
VCVVRRAYRDGVDAFFLFEHDAEVRVAFRVWEAFESTAGFSTIDVTERYKRGPGFG